MYLSVAHQLQVTDQMPKLLEAVEQLRVPDGSEDNRTGDHWMVRRVAAAFLRANRERFAPFMVVEDGQNMPQDAQFEVYCDAVADSAEWGTHLELQAISGALKVPLTVYKAGAEKIIASEDGAEGEALELSYHRHMYSSGEHYNSVVRS